MSFSAPSGKGLRDTTRVEAFSDGVFAIAITLLVLELKVPHLPMKSSSDALVRALLAQWPSYAAFVMSFLAILIMWMNHHEVFKLVHMVHGGFLAANGLVLLVITFLPFPTAVLARHILGPGAVAAAMLYCGSFLLVSMSFLLLWRAAAVSMLLEPGVTKLQTRRIGRSYGIGVVVYLVATLLVLVNPYLGLVVTGARFARWAVLDYDKTREDQKPAE